MSLQTTEPRILSDAATVLANLDTYADRPSLIQLARMIAMTPSNRPLRPVPAFLLGAGQ